LILSKRSARESLQRQAPNSAERSRSEPQKGRPRRGTAEPHKAWKVRRQRVLAYGATTAMLDETADRELFEAWRTGDRAAGQQLIERHYDAIVRFFRTKAGPQTDDLVQRTFLG